MRLNVIKKNNFLNVCHTSKNLAYLLGYLLIVLDVIVLYCCVKQALLQQVPTYSNYMKILDQSPHFYSRWEIGIVTKDRGILSFMYSPQLNVMYLLWNPSRDINSFTYYIMDVEMKYYYLCTPMETNIIRHKHSVFNLHYQYFFCYRVLTTWRIKLQSFFGR